MNEITFYNNSEFGTLRQLTIDNEPWFVGKDVAEALGYERAANAVRKHVDDEDKLMHQIGASGQNRNMTIINESGVYSLIFNSKLPNAKKFKHWVTSEVLPSIRRTGSYCMPTVSNAEQPIKDYNYWVTLPNESDDYQKLLNQERARIGEHEARRRARAQAQDEYREYHANSPILIGTSSEGYRLTDEAQEWIGEYLRDLEKVQICFIYKYLVRVNRFPTDIETAAIEQFLTSTGEWMQMPSTFPETVRNKLRMWERTTYLRLHKGE